MNQGTIIKFKWLNNELKKRELENLRSGVENILSINLLPHFTDHSVEHSDRMIEIIDEFIQPIQESDKKLKEIELVVLYAACYLHDIGMQYEKAGNTRIIRSKLDQEWEELSIETRCENLRKYHHIISAELVNLSVLDSSLPLGFVIPEEFKPDCIAALCEVHNCDFNSQRYSKLAQEISGIRMKLLSGLIRVADILDESRGRASRQKSRVLMLDLSSQVHWWRHYYNEEITFEQNEKKIIIHYDFPKNCEKEYEKIVPLLQIPIIKDELLKHSEIFNKFGLSWTIETYAPKKPYGIADKMPDTVMSEMLRQLHDRKMLESEKNKQIVLESFHESQPYINRRLSELESQKETMSKDKYLCDLAKIAEEIYLFGGKRSSWMLLSSNFRENRSNLKDKKQIEIGLWLMKVMLEDGHPKDAFSVSQQIEGLIERLQDEDIRKENFFILLTKILTDCYDYTEAIKSIKKAIKLTKNNELKNKFEAQLAELHLLQGELNQAFDLVSSVEEVND
ncbi:MAG: HD domain-containing protein [Promethearchaeota archaeon]